MTMKTTHRDRLNIGRLQRETEREKAAETRGRERQEERTKRNCASRSSFLHFFFSFALLGARVEGKEKMANEEELTDYEAERAARIAANRARLGEFCRLVRVFRGE